MNCPKCKSSEIERLSSNYPKSFECIKCGCTFLENPRALVDE